MPALRAAAAERLTRRAGADGAPLASGEGLVVRYGGRTVLDRVSLEVRRREVVSLIGPNGAGKTTAVRALLGLIRPDAGTVRHEPGLVWATSPSASRRIRSCRSPCGAFWRWRGGAARRTPPRPSTRWAWRR